MNDLQEWTVMYFFAADSNIAASMISQLKAITDAGFQADTTVLVHFDPNVNGLPGRVFDINRKRKNDSKKPRPTDIGDGQNFYVRSIREACNELDPIKGKSAADTLARFLEYARTNFRAKNYLLFLVGHGMIVANDSFLPDTPGTDEDSASAITLKELGSVLKGFGDQVKKDKSTFQLVGFHSCSMSSIEVAYELKDSARYMIGTQGLAFPGSWPYRQILKMIFRTIEKETWTDGTKVLPDYDKCTQEILQYIQSLSFYNADDFFLAGYSADISLCGLDSHKIDPLTEAMKALSRSLQAALNDDAAKEVILLAHWKAQSYFEENYTDIYDFCKCLAGRCDSEKPTQMALQQAATAVMNVLVEDSKNPFDRLVPFSDFFGPEYQYSHGLSIYFPWGSPSLRVLERYEAYAFEQTLKPVPTNGDNAAPNDSWLSFLNAYFALTQRIARDREQEIEPSLNGGNGQSARSILNVKTNGNGNGKPTPSLAIGEGKPTPSLAIGEGKPTPSLAIGEGKPTPSLAIGEGKPTPSMGVSGFGFTVTKNYPAPTDRVLSSRPPSPPRQARQDE